MSSIAFDSVHDLVRHNCWWKTTKEVNMIRLHGDVENITANLGYLVTNKLLGSNSDLTSKHMPPKLRTPHKVVVDVIRSVSRSCVAHKPIIAHLFCTSKSARWRTLIPLPAEALLLPISLHVAGFGSFLAGISGKKCTFHPNKWG